MASRYGRLDIVKWLVAEVKVDARAMWADMAAHHWAPVCAHSAVLRWLITHARLPLEARDAVYGQTVLHLCAQRGSLEDVKWLVEEAGANVHTKDWMEREPCDLAKLCRRQGVVVYLTYKEKKERRKVRTERYKGGHVGILR